MSQMRLAGALDCSPLAVAVGIIDSGYRGSLRAIVWAHSQPGASGAWAAAPGLRLRLTLAALAESVPRVLVSSEGAEVPFFSAFAPKRDEDAGYDIAAPRAATLAPGETLCVQLPVAYTASECAGAPYVFGRSSCSLRGLVVLPTAWPPAAPCRFVLKNVTPGPLTVAPGQRVAQLLWLAQRLPWLPPTLNDREPFPTSPPPRAQASAGGALRWRRVADINTVFPPTARGLGCFGSTGV